MNTLSFVDIHCHLLPGIDDGSTSLDESIKMAQTAVADGITTIVTTPHQLGNYGHNLGDDIRARVVELQAELAMRDIPLRVLPGGDVRIEPNMIAGLRNGSVMSLADMRSHVLLELPHELYFPIEPVLQELESVGMQGILSHPERNLGIRSQPKRISRLVDAGCLMQVTAGSLVGTFGPDAKMLAETMVKAGHVHFLATDAHGSKARRPLIHRAFTRVAELANESAAIKMCCQNPALVVAGERVQPGRLRSSKAGLGSWFKTAA